MSTDEWRDATLTEAGYGFEYALKLVWDGLKWVGLFTVAWPFVLIWRFDNWRYVRRTLRRR